MRSVSRRRRRSRGPAGSSSVVKPRVFTARWRSRSRTRRAPPTLVAPSGARKRSWWGRGRTRWFLRRRPSPSGSRRALRMDRSLRAAAGGPRCRRPTTARRRVESRRPRRRQLDGRSRGGMARGSRLVRKERQPPLARTRLLVRARRSGHERAPRNGRASRRRRVRAVPALHRRLPDRRDRCARCRRRPPVSRVVGASAGHFPRRASRGAGRPHLRLRRLPGGVPAQPWRPKW